MENPWVAWYPGDYINKTRSLTMAQHGAYCLLLWEYYVNGGPILANARSLLNICCSRTEADEADVNFVLVNFFVKKGKYWHHERADEEIKLRASIREQRKESGKKGGLAKARNLLEQTSSKKLHSHNHINTNTPLTPLSGGNGSNPLTTRERAKIEKFLQEIARAMQGADYDPRNALERACLKAGVEFERAKEMLP